MFYLLLFIVSASSLLLLFKFYERWQINNFEAIVFNYVTAASIGFLYADHSPIKLPLFHPWLYTALASGLVFISVFSLIAYTVKRAGVSPVTIAQKMSLVIPILFAVFFLNEQLSVGKITGILLALIAIYFTSAKKEKEQIKNFELLVLIFLGSGLVDTLIKIGQVNFIPAIEENLYICCIFASAATAGLFILLYRWLVKGIIIHWKNVLAGIALGSINFISMIAIVRLLALQQFPTAFTFPVSNMGIIIFSIAMARLIFKEHISARNFFGILLAILAILFIAI